MAVTVRPLGAFGIEAGGFPVHEPIDEDVRRELYSLWLVHGIILFRDPGIITRDDHMRISEVFGTLEPHPIERIREPDEPLLIKLAGDSGNYVVEGELRAGFIPWHQDTVSTPAICKGSLLHMVEPAARGGQTAWIDTAKAYDALSDDTKNEIDGLSVVMRLHLEDRGLRFAQRLQSFRYATPDEAPPAKYMATSVPPAVVHPLVAVHPESGRRSLTIAPLYVDAIQGMERARGDALLAALIDHSARPEFTYVHRWEAGDVMLWDNRRTIHTALGWDPALTRTAFRTTLYGSVHSGRYLEPETAGR